MQVLNKKDTKEKRQILRKNQTDSETILWSKLRAKRFYGLKFFRQYGVGNYIVDFYCPKLKLVVEADGGQHFTDQSLEYDKNRTEFLNSLGIKVIRFTNKEINKNIDGCMEKLWLEGKLSLTLSLTKERE